jgi:hypothetical protein
MINEMHDMNARHENQNQNQDTPPKRLPRIFSMRNIIFVLVILFLGSCYTYLTRYSNWAIKRNLFNIKNYEEPMMTDTISIGGQLYYFQIPDKSFAGKLNLCDLKHDESRYHYQCVDPFTSGEFCGAVQYGYDWERQPKYRTVTGDLFRYYTDGESFYILVSAGPDRIYEDVSEGDVWEMDKIPRYDPANGFRSSGDIIIEEEGGAYSG